MICIAQFGHIAFLCWIPPTSAFFRCLLLEFDIGTITFLSLVTILIRLLLLVVGYSLLVGMAPFLILQIAPFLIGITTSLLLDGIGVCSDFLLLLLLSLRLVCWDNFDSKWFRRSQLWLRQSLLLYLWSGGNT